MHRAISGCFKFSGLIGKLHATSVVFSNYSRYTTFTQALELLVARDLSVGFFRGQAPPAEYRVHCGRVLQLTILRHRFTRGRYEWESPILFSEVDELCHSLMGLLNGDWRVCCIQHYCYLPGCCDGGSVKVTRPLNFLGLSLIFPVWESFFDFITSGLLAFIPHPNLARPRAPLAR